MIKRLRIIILMILLINLAWGEAVDIVGKEITTIANVLEDIRISQGVSSFDEIRLDLIDKEELGRLGRTIIETSADSESYKEFISQIMGSSNYDTLQDIYESAGALYIANGFQLAGDTSQKKSSKFEYHIGLGELILLIILVLLVLLTEIFRILKLKHTRSGNR